jgi:NAD(P)-dependent dehydrogenase (short-subunit alcohol dehydrogenase family)
MERFTNRAVIVTGAGRGIGLACARAFAAEGGCVVIAEIDEESGRAAAEAIGSAGGRALFVRTDVGDARSVGAMIDATLEWAGRVDVLVNNAAIIRATDFLTMDPADLEAVLRVNLIGAALCSQAAARVMAARGGGVIVNMSSVNGILAIPNQTPYNISKGGLNQLTRVTALALAPHNIRVNAVAPGSIRTEMLETVMQDETARRTILSRTPLGRVGEPEEVAKVVLFLASDDSSYMTGQIVYVDGGRLALNYTVPVPE